MGEILSALDWMNKVWLAAGLRTIDRVEYRSGWAPTDLQSHDLRDLLFHPCDFVLDPVWAPVLEQGSVLFRY